MGYVGTVSAACFAELGHDVIGVDVNPRKLEMLNRGLSPVVEEGIDEAVQAGVDAGPLRVGSGTRIKIYETMAMRRPVVSTTIGAEGLPLEAGVHYRRADHPQEFAAEIFGLLDCPEDGRELADDAFDFILKCFSNRHIVRQFEDICGRAIGDSESMPAPAVRKPQTALAG